MKFIGIMHKQRNEVPFHFCAYNYLMWHNRIPHLNIFDEPDWFTEKQAIAMTSPRRSTNQGHGQLPRKYAISAPTELLSGSQPVTTRRTAVPPSKYVPYRISNMCHQTDKRPICCGTSVQSGHTQCLIIWRSEVNIRSGIKLSVLPNASELPNTDESPNSERERSSERKRVSMSERYKREKIFCARMLRAYPAYIARSLRAHRNVHLEVEAFQLISLH